MDDTEVTRQAIGICLTSLSKLESQKTKLSEKEILRSYLELCPFVASTSPAIKAALDALENAPNRRRGHGLNHHNIAKQPTPEALRVSMRICISAWSQLLVQAQTLDDFELIQRYLLQCPFISSTSEITTFVLQGLQKASIQNTPALGGLEEESESEDSVDKGRDSTNESAKKKEGPASTSSTSQQKKLKYNAFLFVIRSVLLDFPMAFLFATYLGLMWVHRVDQLYIVPSMRAAEWTDERAEQEITYYNRRCSAVDMTAKTADELLVPLDATIQEAYEHQLKHGFSIFQGVLTEDVMLDLRTYVDSRNRKLTAEESIFVIENKNRFSFGLGTEVPAVFRAVKQLATHSKLAPALERVLGPKPALIEMTAITASYGAVSQYWHDDVIAAASAMKYGRSFGPSYSVFIQLQNTTKAMGATSACPGSHKCSSGEIEKFCESHGFQAIDSQTGYWKAGDALLMNMNSYHRGFAHTDNRSSASDRVMLILTFVPKPEKRAESRQLSQGITFSLRWDMWGHTLWDLAQADTRMTQPWATLRALGLYKPKDAAWGVDYVSSATMRMANEDNGFRRDELDTFLERGGFRWLPQFLHGQVKENENWHEFLVDTVERCLEFLGFVNIFVVSLYGFSLVVLLGLLPDHFGLHGLGHSVLRSAIAYGLVYIVWQAANFHVDNTDWAKDIRAGRRYSVDFGSEGILTASLDHLPSTLPHRKDVLIETRYGSKQFHMYNDFTNDHPGSRAFQKVVQQFAEAYSKVQSDMFRDATAAYAVSHIHEKQGRFLLQKGNEWLWMSPKEEIDFAKSELAVASKPVLGHLRQSIRFLESEYKYGFIRHTALAFKSLEGLKELKKKLLRDTPSGDAIFSALEGIPNDVNVASSANKFGPLRHKLVIPSTLRSLEIPMFQRRIVDIAPKPTEPKPDEWLSSGMIIEGTEFLDDGEAHWYKGVLEKVTAAGDYFAMYDDKSFGVLGENLIRTYQPYYVGEEVEVFMGNNEVEFCTIGADNGDGTFDLLLGEEGGRVERLKRVPTADLRRLREDEIQEEREVRNHYA